MKTHMRGFAVLLPVIVSLLAAGDAEKIPAKALKMYNFVELVKRVDKESSRSAMPGKVFIFAEEDINAYFEYAAGKQSGKTAVKDIKINLRGQNVFELSADVEFDISAILGGEGSFVKKLLKKSRGMKNSIFLEAKTSSAKGKGIVLIQSIRINGLKLPDKLLDEALRNFGGKRRPPINPYSLTDIPYGIQKIEILPGSLRVKL